VCTRNEAEKVEAVAKKMNETQKCWTKEKKPKKKKKKKKKHRRRRRRRSGYRQETVI
jgi:hypothetical protein